MCECRKTIEERLKIRFIEQYPNATEHNVTLTGYALLIDDDELKMKGHMEFKVTALHPLKKGGEKLKTFTQNMIFSYCPFCGERYAA